MISPHHGEILRRFETGDLRPDDSEFHRPRASRRQPSCPRKADRAYGAAGAKPAAAVRWANDRRLKAQPSRPPGKTRSESRGLAKRGHRQIARQPAAAALSERSTGASPAGEPFPPGEYQIKLTHLRQRDDRIARSCRPRRWKRRCRSGRVDKCHWQIAARRNRKHDIEIPVDLCRRARCVGNNGQCTPRHWECRALRSTARPLMPLARQHQAMHWLARSAVPGLTIPSPAGRLPVARRGGTSCCPGGSRRAQADRRPSSRHVGHQPGNQVAPCLDALGFGGAILLGQRSVCRAK